MNKRIVAVISALLMEVYSPSASANCEDGHWVKSVSSDGKIVVLEDGTVWKVDDADADTTALWLPTTEIVACDDKLIDTDDGETVEAERIH